MSEELQEIIRLRDAITVTLTEDENDINQVLNPRDNRLRNQIHNKRVYLVMLNVVHGF